MNHEYVLKQFDIEPISDKRYKTDRYGLEFIRAIYFDQKITVEKHDDEKYDVVLDCTEVLLAERLAAYLTFVMHIIQKAISE